MEIGIGYVTHAGPCRRFPKGFSALVCNRGINRFLSLKKEEIYNAPKDDRQKRDRDISRFLLKRQTARLQLSLLFFLSWVSFFLFLEIITRAEDEPTPISKSDLRAQQHAPKGDRISSTAPATRPPIYLVTLRVGWQSIPRPPTIINQARPSFSRSTFSFLKKKMIIICRPSSTTLYSFYLYVQRSLKSRTTPRSINLDKK